MALRFHWRLLQGGDDLNLPREMQNPMAVTGLPDLDQQIEFCRAAEQAGSNRCLPTLGGLNRILFPLLLFWVEQRRRWASL